MMLTEQLAWRLRACLINTWHTDVPALQEEKTSVTWSKSFPKFICPNNIFCLLISVTMPEILSLENDGLNMSKGERQITFNSHFHLSLPFLLKDFHENVKESKIARILASVCGLAVWFWLGKTWFLGYEKTSHMKMKPQAKSKPQHSEVFLSQAGSELWQRFRRTLCSVGKTLPGLSTALPPQNPKLQCYLKKSVRKDFSFPDHWQMFAQIYFGGISSTLLSFLPQELKEYFKNAFIFPLSLYPSVASYILSLLLSFCPSFILDLLGFSVGLSVTSWKKPVVAEAE